VALSALTPMNSTMLVGARSNYALAGDWAAFGFMGRWHGPRSAPQAGFIVQALITLGLIGIGALAKDGFSALVEFTAPVFWFFFMLTGVALLVLRWKEPGHDPAFHGAVVSLATARVHSDLRVPAVLEHPVCAVRARDVCGPFCDDEWRSRRDWAALT